MFKRIMGTLVVLLALTSGAYAQTLTFAQRTAINANIQASVDLVGKTDTAIAVLYNQPAVPTFYIFRTQVPIQEIKNQFVWANFTPSDTPDGTQTWLNRATGAQGKQFNLQLILEEPSGFLDATRANIRLGLQDALTNFYTGTNGAAVTGGWANVRDLVLARPATRIEKLLATTTVQQDGSTPAKAGTPNFEGEISVQQVSDAMNGL